MSDTVYDIEKMKSRMNEHFPLIANHEKRTQEWFKGAGLGLFIHWDHASEQGIEISWPMVGGVFSLPGGRVVTVDDYYSTEKSFNPTKWDPKEIARLAKEAGMA
jgi:alpha-L-fucosidase